MNNLRNAVRSTLNENSEQPFTVYTSIKEQRLLNVPIAKPLLIVVLNGHKELGANNELVCQSGEFIFLSNSSAINMRNIPKNNEYFALLIEFEHQDFDGLQVNSHNKKEYHIGTISNTFMKCLQQFVNISQWAPRGMWSSRKREIITLLCHMGHREVLSLLANPQLKDRLHEMFIKPGGNELTTEDLCEQLAMSESTLRRKLKLEGTSVQNVKDGARLGGALHLLQTSLLPIGVIAERCGYQSQSRFTDRFKKRFGLTPSELRKTKLTE